MNAASIVPCLTRLVAVLSAIILTGCLPNRLVINLDPGDGQLESTTVMQDDGASARSPKVALIDVTGMISHQGSPGLIASSANPVDALATRLREVEEDDQVRAVIIRINSPGGTVAATETMFNEVQRFKQRSGLPVVISMSEVAASGGYYLALAGDHIVAQPSSVTGSIGVIMQTVNVSGAMERFGIEARSVTSGDNKAMASPFEPAQDSHYAILQSMVDDFYMSFRTAVVDARSLSASDADRLTDGRIFTGRQAHDAGLVDELGDLNTAWDRAKSLAGITRSRLVKYHATGSRPSSPYAALNPGAPTTSEINVFTLDLGTTASPQFGFYYLWSPVLDLGASN